MDMIPVWQKGKLGPWERRQGPMLCVDSDCLLLYPYLSTTEQLVLSSDRDKGTMSEQHLPRKISILVVTVTLYQTAFNILQVLDTICTAIWMHENLR